MKTNPDDSRWVTHESLMKDKHVEEDTSQSPCNMSAISLMLVTREAQGHLYNCSCQVLTCSNHKKNTADYLPDDCKWGLYKRWWNVTSEAGLKVWAVITRRNSRLSSGRIAHIALQGGWAMFRMTVCQGPLFTGQFKISESAQLEECWFRSTEN